MRYIKFLFGLLIVVLSGCGQAPIEAQHKNLKAPQVYPSHVIFGVFCGECAGHCATMYRYNMTGDSNTLFIDSTDSYFKNNGKVVCKTQINDSSKFNLVNKLVQQIPRSFIKTARTEQTFGCPDCTDGCGIYFEIGQGTVIKKFYIDYHTSELNKEVKDFGEFIKATLERL